LEYDVGEVKKFRNNKRRAMSREKEREKLK
jgi:hypothetical protein